MTLSTLSALIILITLPLSYGFVKLISAIYETREAGLKRFNLGEKHLMNQSSPHFE